MKKLFLICTVVTVALSLSLTSCEKGRSVSLTKSVDTASYAIGYSNGVQFAQMMKNVPGEPMNVDALLAGMEDAFKEKDGKITETEARDFLNSYFEKAQKAEASEKLEEGKKFLEENKTKEGVITTESGLQYKVEKEGEGVRPTADDTVKVHYTGTLLDGTVFDSSVDRGEPATFGVKQVIAGWTEGLQLMTPGSKYTFWIPAELAYGERGAGQMIKPNSTLKFEVELIEVMPKKD